MTVPQSKPSIRRTDMSSVLGCLVNDQLGPGYFAAELAKDFAGYLGSLGGLALRDIERALRVLIRAGGLEPGTRIALSALDNPVYFRAIQEAGMVPVVADIAPESFILSWDDVKRRGGARMVLQSALLGEISDLAPALEDGAIVVEELSHAIGANTSAGKLGTKGAFAIIGLEDSHLLTAGGGAAVLANGKKELTALKKVAEEFAPEILLPDMNAALGLTQLREIDGFLNRRKEIRQVFEHALLRTRHKTMLQQEDGERVPFCFPVIAKSMAKDIVAYARKNGVQAGFAFERSILGQRLVDEQDYPMASGMLLRCISFPLYPSMNKKQVEHCEKILSTLP